MGLIALIEAFTVKADGSYDTIACRGRRAFTVGLFSTCLSPKTGLFYMVILSQYDFQVMTVAAGIVLAGLIHMVLRLAWYGTWIHLIQPMRVAMDGLWVLRSMKLVTGALMMALSLHVIF